MSDLKRALAFLCVEFGGEVDTWEARTYERVLKDVQPDVLQDAAELLVQEAAAGRRFFPMPRPHDWLGASAKVILQRRKAMLAQLEAASGTCPMCEGRRWRSELIDGVERLRRCDCWTRMMSALDASGKRLALPEVTEEASSA